MGGSLDRPLSFGGRGRPCAPLTLVGTLERIVCDSSNFSFSLARDLRDFSASATSLDVLRGDWSTPHTGGGLSLSRARIVAPKFTIGSRTVTLERGSGRVAPVADATRGDRVLTRGSVRGRRSGSTTSETTALALNAVRTTSITLGRLRPLSSWLGSHTMTSRGQTKTPAVWGIDRVRWRSRGLRAATLDNQEADAGHVAERLRERRQLWTRGLAQVIPALEKERKRKKKNYRNAIPVITAPSGIALLDGRS